MGATRGLLVACGIGLAGCGGGDKPRDNEGAVTVDGGTDALSDVAPSAVCPAHIEWGACPPPPAGEKELDPRLRCATLEVPLDYKDGSLGTVSLALIATFADPAARRGMVLTNFGGPGASGRTILRRQVGLISVAMPEFFRGYDLMSFDPRGVGESTKFDCGAPLDFDEIMSLPTDPSDDEAWAKLLSESERVTRACDSKVDPKFLARLDTDTTARDVDCIRSAMGDTKLNYYGASYGTYLGAKYATLFPDRVDRFVLDSVTGLHDDLASGTKRRAASYELALKRWAEKAGADSTYSFHGGEGADVVMAKLDLVRATCKGRATTATEVGEFGFAAAVAFMLRSGGLKELAYALTLAEGGDHTALREAAAKWFGVGNPNPYTATVTRLDQECPTLDRAQWREHLNVMATESPHFAVLFGRDGLACLFSSAKPAHPIEPVRPVSTPKMLAFIGAFDPATPASRSTELLGALGNNAYVVRFVGEGHGYLTRSSCVIGLADRFMGNPSQPPSVETCD